MKQFSLSILAGVYLLLNAPAFGQITGQIQRNTDVSNLVNKAPAGLAQVRVRAYNAQGQLLSSATSDASGNYRLDLPAGQRVRVEFGEWPQGFSPAPGQMATQFVSTPAQIDLNLWQPGQYVGSAIHAVQTLYTSSGSKNQSNSSAALVSFPASESASGQSLTLANAAQAGALWGIAYERNSQRLFTAAFAKRHSPLGPLGSGGIYVTNPQQSALKPFIDLATLGVPTAPANLTRDLSDKDGVFNHDSLMFALVGKVGLGGIDASDDGQYLWVMNLYDRKLYRIALPANGEVPTSASLTGYAVPAIGRRGEIRPFAVKYYGGKVYVGVVSDATAEKATTADLSATVLAFDPAREKFDEVFSMALDYPRGILDYGISGWRPWTDEYTRTIVGSTNGWMIYPQPILADIEFDTDGSMILGLMDRLGHQTGEGHLYRPKWIRQLQQIRGLAGGDVLRVAYRPAERGGKRFELEHNGQAGDRITAGQGNGEGPSGGEFYFDDAFKANGITWHHETASGGLALLPDQQQVLVAAREPEQGGYLGGGVKWFNNHTGAAERGLSVLPKGKTNPFGKANNVGDIELITKVPPTEIGDRVWLDCDEDGIQDADETPLANIEVGLYRNGTLLATTKTNAEGQYIFTDAMITEGIRPRTAYELRVATRQATYTDLKLTSVRQGNNAEIDNDAVFKDGYAVIQLQTTAPGENIRNLDFGFRCTSKPQVVAKLTCSGSVATLILTGQQPTDRFDLTTDRMYTGNAQFSQATSMPRNGQVLSDQFVNWPEDMTVRVFNEAGCFADVYIKQTDATGCEPVLKGEDVIGLLASPNPTADYLLLRYRSQRVEGSVQLLLRDIQGRTLINQTAELKAGRHQTQLNLSQYQPGNYIITVQDGEKQTSQTIIKR